MEKTERRYAVTREPKVETEVTAKGGAFTFRVLAYRRLNSDEARKVVWRALQVGFIQEPEVGGVVILKTKIGHRTSDEIVNHHESPPKSEFIE